MTNTENSSQPDTLRVALEALASKYETDLVEVIWSAADHDDTDLGREAVAVLETNLTYISDSVYEDLLEEYCPETQIEDDEDDE